MYFDPGTGSLIIQVIVAGLAVLAGYFGIIKGRFLGFFKKGKKNDDAINDGETKDDDEL